MALAPAASVPVGPAWGELGGGSLSRVLVAAHRQLERRVVLTVLPETLSVGMSEGSAIWRVALGDSVAQAIVRTVSSRLRS